MTTSGQSQEMPPGESRIRADEISLAELIQKACEWAQIVWEERRFVAKVVAVAVSIGLVIAFGSQSEYTATTRILPYRSGGGTSGLSSLAGLAGVRLPQGATDQTITADLYPEVVKTLDFRVAVAETPIRFSSLPKPVTPMQYFREIAKPSLVDILTKYSIGLPRTVLSAIVQRQEMKPLAGAESGSTIKFFDTGYRNVLEGLEERLTATSDKKTGILLVSARMPDPYAAADLVRVSSDRLMQRIIEYDSRKAGESFRFLDEQFQQAKVQYERAQRELANFADRNRALMSATAQIDRDRLKREYDIAFEVYQQFSREREQARIKMNQDTPVFTVLEQVVVPEKKSSPRKGLILLTSMFIGALVAFPAIVGRRISSRETLIK